MRKVIAGTVFVFLFSLLPVFGQNRDNPDRRIIVDPILSVTPVRFLTPREVRLTLRPTISIPFVRRDEVKKSLCERLKERVHVREENLTRLANHLVEVFTSIVARVDEFYQTKLVPQGKTTGNYKTLMAEINANQTILRNKLAELQNTVETTSCDGDNPGFVASVLKDQMHEVIAAMQEYKKSVRNLIVEVHTANARNNRPDQATNSAVAN